jgi:hypothetical protein
MRPDNNIYETPKWKIKTKMKCSILCIDSGKFNIEEVGKFE